MSLIVALLTNPRVLVVLGIAVSYGMLCLVDNRTPWPHTPPDDEYDP